MAVSESNYYTILAVSSNNGLADWVETGSAGDWAYTRDYEVTFTNGTVFNSNASIAAFYNSVFNSRDHSTKAAINSDKALITGELDAIEGVVSGGIVLTVSLAS